MKHTILKICVGLLISIACVHANAAKLYKWVDTNGNISYQDQPPPKDSTILSEKEVGSRLADEAETDADLPQITIYTVSDCELCERFGAILKQNKVPHIELPLEDDRQAQTRILDKVSSIIAPTIFIGEEIIQGGTEDRLKEQLRLAGFTIKESPQVKSSNRLTIDE